MNRTDKHISWTPELDDLLPTLVKQNSAVRMLLWPETTYDEQTYAVHRLGDGGANCGYLTKSRWSAEKIFARWTARAKVEGNTT